MLGLSGGTQRSHEGTNAAAATAVGGEESGCRGGAGEGEGAAPKMDEAVRVVYRDDELQPVYRGLSQTAVLQLNALVEYYKSFNRRIEVDEAWGGGQGNLSKLDKLGAIFTPFSHPVSTPF